MISRFGYYTKVYNKTFKLPIRKICYNIKNVPELTIQQLEKIKSKPLFFRKTCSLERTKETILTEKLQYNIYNTDPCKYCQGTGVVICHDCDGYGRHYFDGFKEFICDSCSGTGGGICNICGGNGQCHRVF
jgi:hypothetical protein